MSRSFALLALLLAGCAGDSPNGPVSSALVGPPVGGGTYCVLDQTACDTTMTALYVCGQPYNGGAGGGSGVPTEGTWDYVGSCPTGCFTSQDSSGLEHDYCGCVANQVRCVNGILRVCDSTGHYWMDDGNCSSRCPCGGVYPNCRACF